MILFGRKSRGSIKNQRPTLDIQSLYDHKGSYALYLPIDLGSKRIELMSDSESATKHAIGLCIYGTKQFL
ncbi:hypothetical protein QG37_01465 [Candidozyma auris]|nr:hypothetical protein QG37_01465 [[Candida] auris]